MTTPSTQTSLSEEDLVQLEENAKLMFSIEEISIILNVKLDFLKFMITEPGSPEYLRFKKGRLEAEASIRKSIFDLANNGSSPAQTQMLALIESAKISDVL